MERMTIPPWVDDDLAYAKADATDAARGWTAPNGQAGASNALHFAAEVEGEASRRRADPGPAHRLPGGDRLLSARRHG
jgi:hypothetical protein